MNMTTTTMFHLDPNMTNTPTVLRQDLSSTESGYLATDTNYWSNVTAELTNDTLFGNASQRNDTFNIISCNQMKATFHFNQLQIIRVVITWFLFVISLFGNLFVLMCVYKKARTSHVHMIMMHLTLADLAFTLLVMPNDAIWNTTMEWKVGGFLCKLCQMFKQMGMYISSFMVVVIALDRCCSILQPMSTPTRQRVRTKYMVGGACILSILSAIPSAVMFSVFEAPYCADRPPFQQCVDFAVVTDVVQRRPYYFFTMFMTFILPMLFTVVSYSLVICEISDMMVRDRAMMGRRGSSLNIIRARRKALFMTSMVTLTFVLLWGPYYAFGLYTWFNPDTATQTPRQISMVLFLLMYVHPAIHPFLYGVFMKDVRVKFGETLSRMEKFVTCNNTELAYGEKTIRCLSSSRKNHGHNNHSNGYSKHSSYSAMPKNASQNRVGFDLNAPPSAPDFETEKLVACREEDSTMPEMAIEFALDGPRIARCSTSSFRLSDSLAEFAVNNNNEVEQINEDCDDDVFNSTVL